MVRCVFLSFFNKISFLFLLNEFFKFFLKIFGELKEVFYGFILWFENDELCFIWFELLLKFKFEYFKVLLFCIFEVFWVDILDEYLLFVRWFRLFLFLYFVLLNYLVESDVGLL